MAFRTHPVQDESVEQPCCGHQDVITPLPLTSVAAAKLFEHFDIRPQLVYIDGDHEYESVIFDLRLWLKLLRPNGILIGDDYAWAGVRKAVDQIVAEENVEKKIYGQKFTLRRS